MKFITRTTLLACTLVASACLATTISPPTLEGTLDKTHTLHIPAPLECSHRSPGEVVHREIFIGEHREVRVEETSLCPDSAPPGKPHLKIRQTLTNETNVCGAPCATHCFTPSGGGPNPNECNVIADALRYESEHTGALFRIAAAANVSMTYRSCTTFFTNQAFNTLIYCRTEWANLVDYVATNCQAAQNAHGGLCVDNLQRWFVQVQNRTG